MKQELRNEEKGNSYSRSQAPAWERISSPI